VEEVTQAECLRELEQADAVATAARAFIQAGFTAGQGYAGDAEYSAVSWLIHRTHVTRGAAVGHAAWARRVRTHPRVIAALAAGQVPESVGRLICLWSDRLPEQFRDQADELLLVAAASGLGLEELAALAAQITKERGRTPAEDAQPIGPSTGRRPSLSACSVTRRRVRAALPMTRRWPRTGSACRLAIRCRNAGSPRCSGRTSRRWVRARIAQARQAPPLQALPDTAVTA